MTRKMIKMILAVFLASFLLPGMALGATGYEIKGDSNGLVIESPDAPAMTGNLNPGDGKNSRLRLTNQGNHTLTVYVRTEIVSETTVRGGHLADVMTLAIKDGSNTLVNDTFREVVKKQNITVGRMAPGAEKVLEFDTNLAGADTDNQYQGAVMKVVWVFTTTAVGGGGDDDNDGDDPIDEPVVVPEEPDVLEPEEIIVPPEPESPLMPGTGVGSPIGYYAVGSAALIAGLLLNKKNKDYK